MGEIVGPDPQRSMTTMERAGSLVKKGASQDFANSNPNRKNSVPEEGTLENLLGREEFFSVPDGLSGAAGSSAKEIIPRPSLASLPAPSRSGAGAPPEVAGAN